MRKHAHLKLVSRVNTPQTIGDLIDAARINPEETFDRQNKPYYPYFIYKILENMFCKSSKIRILECIHLQSRETVIDNDLIYEKICDSSNGEFTFKPTDRNEHM